MKKQLGPYPDLLRRDQIQTYILKKSGTLVTQQRIGHWIAGGEIQLLHRPRRLGGGWFTRRKYLDALIKKYAA